MGLANDGSFGCVRCEVDASRGRERDWLLAAGETEGSVSLLQFVWRYQTVAAGRFVGLANVGHGQSRGFRSFETRRVLRSGDGFVDCECVRNLQLLNETPLRRMVRQDVRDVVSDRFGDTLTVAQLVSLPVGWVIWSNAYLVCVGQSDDGRYVLACNGISLEECLARYVSAGNRSLASSLQSFSEDHVRDGYCYLKLVLPGFKLAAERICGTYPQLALVFSLPDAWFDWARFTSLYVSGESLCHVDDLKGEPLVTWLLREIGGALCKVKSDMQIGGTVRAKLDPETLCIQVVGEEAAWQNAYAKPVALRSREHNEVPLGYVRLRPDSDGLAIFPAGLRVHMHGTVFGAPGVRVAVVVQGAVAMALSRDGDVRRITMDSVAVEYRSMRDGIGAWYSSIIDHASTTARFVMRARAKFVVLRWPTSLRSDACKAVTVPSRSVAITDPLERWVGIHETRLEFDAASNDIWANLQFSDTYRVLSHFRGGGDKIRVNGCVSVGADDSLAVVGQISVHVDQNEHSSGASVHQSVMWDNYVLDDGGPSGSDGEFLPELGFHQVIDGDALYTHRYDGTLLAGLDQVHLADVPGFCYVRMLRGASYASIANQLGAFPRLSELLHVSASCFDTQALSQCQLVKRDECLHVQVSESGDFRHNGWEYIVQASYVLAGSMGQVVEDLDFVEVLVARDKVILDDRIIGAAVPRYWYCDIGYMERGRIS